MLHRLDDAILDFVTATRLDPTHGFAFNNLGLCYLLAAKPERAVAPLEKAATLLPEVAFVHNNLGIAYERSDQKAEAREEYSKALELDPSYVKAAVNKARLSALAAADEIAVDPSSSAEDAASDVLATPASEDESNPQGAAGAPAGPGGTP
jgi:Flp pilus assembly protein TadD